MTLRTVFTAAAATAAITLGGAAQAQNCAEVLGRTQEASQFANALTRTGQTVLLRSSGPFTILVGHLPRGVPFVMAAPAR